MKMVGVGQTSSRFQSRFSLVPRFYKNSALTIPEYIAYVDPCIKVETV